MKIGKTTSGLACVSLLMVAGVAYATQPPCATSDSSESTACGSGALLNNNPSMGGNENSALGYQALNANISGGSNTTTGAYSMLRNTSGSNNTADGFGALYTNTSGDSNTASGFQALYSNTTGYGNNAVGSQVLYTNTSGYFNNAVGFDALFTNTTGYNNNALGSYALSSDTTGHGNTAIGANALLNVTTGIRNIGLGNNAGTNLVAGSYNVDIGWGADGGVDETGVIRIGDPTYATATYITGISGSVVTGAAVYVTSSGQLGVLASSERFKTDIAPMRSDEKLQQLRPVSFHLRTDPQGTVQYGLIAEEVDKVYPELVIRDQAGQIQGVRYDELAPILLSEIQRQRERIVADRDELNSEEARRESELGELRQQMAQIQESNRAMQALLAKLSQLN
jgi:Chaperone of endosialidase